MVELARFLHSAVFFPDGREVLLVLRFGLTHLFVRRFVGFGRFPGLWRVRGGRLDGCRTLVRGGLLGLFLGLWLHAGAFGLNGLPARQVRVFRRAHLVGLAGVLEGEPVLLFVVRRAAGLQGLDFLAARRLERLRLRGLERLLPRLDGLRPYRRLDGLRQTGHAVLLPLVPAPPGLQHPVEELGGLGELVVRGVLHRRVERGDSGEDRAAQLELVVRVRRVREEPALPVGRLGPRLEVVRLHPQAEPLVERDAQRVLLVAERRRVDDDARAALLLCLRGGFGDRRFRNLRFGTGGVAATLGRARVAALGVLLGAVDEESVSLV